MDSPLIRNKK
jgi:hypothetical protein